MRISIVRYPGSFGLEPAVDALMRVCGHECRVIGDETEELGEPEPQLILLPGGRSYGDYLRPGGLAKVSRISGSIRRFADNGGIVLGIGNGFQILCELGLLPGAFLLNQTTQIVTGRVYVRIENQESVITKNAKKQVLRLPIACEFGRYYADGRNLRDLEEGGQVLLRYCDEEGELDPENERTGSINQIAGIMNREGNVIGMMVRPELAVEAVTGGTDGIELLRAAA